MGFCIMRKRTFFNQLICMTLMSQVLLIGTNVFASESETVDSTSSEIFTQPLMDSEETSESTPAPVTSSEEVPPLASSEEMRPSVSSSETSESTSESEETEGSSSDLARILRYELSPAVVNYQANSKGYLKIPVYNNSKDYQTTHPAVLYFANGWNGYKFWMGHTPYEDTNDLLENPSIVASNDGINWVEPKGLVNPLEKTDSKSMHYSDPHLVFVNNQLEYWYRQVTRDPLPQTEIIIRKRSSDGINWSAEEVLYTRNGSEADLLSPVVHYENGKYRIWVSNFNQDKFEYFESTTGDNWTKIRDIVFPAHPDDLKPWHMDIVKKGNLYELYYNAGWNDVTQRMSYATSTDNINYTFVADFMVNMPNNFDEIRIYRPSIVDIGGIRYLYYAGSNSVGQWYIGLSLGTPSDPTNFTGMNFSAQEEIVRSKETKAISYETERREDSTLSIGQEVVEQVGIPGEKTITFEVKYINGTEVSRTVISEEVTKAPVKEIIRVGVKEQKIGWRFENGNWYYYDSNGERKTNWLKVGNQWYYLNSNGVMQVGWIKLGSQWYYLNPSGAMHVGWLKSGNYWYYLNPSGEMRVGWLLLGNQWFYLNPGGDMRVGWLLSGNQWYYLNPGGDMHVGWLLLGNQWYYLNSSGAMVTGRQYINGVWYTFAGSGALQ